MVTQIPLTEVNYTIDLTKIEAGWYNIKVRAISSSGISVSGTNTYEFSVKV
ncbi:MAG: hypothetical protein ACTSPV_19150 [Candidatus Hodarchaeales archaeon]